MYKSSLLLLAGSLCLCSAFAQQNKEINSEVFGSKHESEVPYRIPALAQTADGSLIAVADYRYSHADIGVVKDGKLDIRARISNDQGASWNPLFTIAVGTGAGGSGEATFHNAFGDPCLVADRHSNRVLMLCCAGNVSFQRGTDLNHQDVAYFLSADGGRTWGEPIPITEQFYAPLRRSVRGPMRALFVGSGKIHQSRYVKVGNFYRLYCAVLAKDVNKVYCNYVFYSDDFGHQWHLLGSADQPAIPCCTDEPKTEELPDGSVVCSGRTHGGRWFNIFRFTNPDKAEGAWGTPALSDPDNGGIFAADCNGELLVVPAVRRSDGRKLWLALQSVPADATRTKVSIYYKELESAEADYCDAFTLARDWDGLFRCSDIGSSYSTMILKQDGRIGFFYEEDRYQINGGCTMVYKDYSIHQITDGRYSLR